MTATNTATESRRRALADAMAASGDLRSSRWRAAVEAVPRELFLPSGLFTPDNSGPYTTWKPVRPDEDGYLDLVYQDRSWVTQLDGTTVPPQVSEPVDGAPTSSSTLPSLVVRMLEDLHVEDGMRVLEIGTGTGYSTALLCERLGDDCVTSVEVDPAVAAQAEANLASASYRPRLLVSDGLAGDEGQRFDRIIATCSVRYIPPAWLAQAAPGATILTTLFGWMNAYAYVRLTMSETGTGHGVFLPGGVNFMPARTHAAPPLPVVPTEFEDERPTSIGQELATDSTAAWLAQLVAPQAIRVSMTNPDGSSSLLILDTASDWAARFTPTEDGTYTLGQTGTGRLGDRVEEAITAWIEAGSPGPEEFLITVEDNDQSVSCSGLGTWSLAAAS